MYNLFKVDNANILFLEFGYKIQSSVLPKQSQIRIEIATTTNHLVLCAICRKIVLESGTGRIKKYNQENL